MTAVHLWRQQLRYCFTLNCFVISSHVILSFPPPRLSREATTSLTQGETYIALFATLLLSGPLPCFAQEVDPSTTCISNLAENPDFQIISNKVALSGASNQTIEMLTNKSKPKKNEKAVISKWNSSLKECFDLGKQYSKEYYSEYMQSAKAETFQNFEKLVEKLYLRKITYGAFANARAAELEKYNAKVLKNQRNIEAQKNLETTVKIKPM